MNKLIRLRKKYKYTSSHMAEMLNISKPYYWQIEHGRRRLTYEMAIKIASIFNTKPDDIFYKEFTKK